MPAIASVAAARRTLRPLVSRLEAADVPALRLSSWEHVEATRSTLQRYPGRSVWVPETLEYAIVGPWRHRPDIASVNELEAVRNLESLLTRAADLSADRGERLLLAIELETSCRQSRFARAGMTFLEEVITYEVNAARLPRVSSRDLPFEPVRVPSERALAELMSVDHAAFPWLWQNSHAEFAHYISSPDVSVSLLRIDGESAAYVGTTLFPGWGHLDRIAVAPQFQGRGLGRIALSHAVEVLTQQGARRIGLSTQRMNHRSQRLYERAGFWRTPELDYQLFGFWNERSRRPANTPS